MKIFRLIGIPVFIILGCLALSAVFAARMAEAATVVELFTSQGCPSCPPADRFLTKLAKEDDIIALSCHVDYWDNPGWKDSFSMPACTQRQYDYVELFEGRNLYTPQIVVNGTEEFAGTNFIAAWDTMRRARNKNVVTTIMLNLADDSKEISASLPAVPSGTYYLTLFARENTVTQMIGGSENSGRTVDYANPVKAIIPVGLWDGQAKIMNIELPLDGNAAQAYVLIAQSRLDGQILAAGQIAVSGD